MNIFIRNEIYQNEYRCPLSPADIKILIEHGFRFVVQKSSHRIFTNQEFADISGLVLTNKEWYEPEFQTFLILGIKELSHLHNLHSHTHLYFSHSFKQQENSYQILSAFAKSKSILHDFEFLLDSSGNRLIAFGFYAGLAGATLGLQEFFQKSSGNSIQNLTHWNSFHDMLTSLSIPLQKQPKILIIGSKGRCGSGVCSVLQTLSIPFSTMNKNEPLQDFYQFDIIFNCILLDTTYTTIWFPTDFSPNHHTVIVDISCDYSKPNNPIPLYSKPTTWNEPVYTPHPNISIIAIENLPSLLPKESSIHFSKQLTKLFLENDEEVWIANKNYFLKLLTI